MHPNLYSVNFQQLEVFFHSAERMSFTKAAAELQMTQSAVSKNIAKLEHDLGFPLFTRHNRELALTTMGKQLYDAWTTPASVLSNTYASLFHMTEETANRLCIGTTNTTDLSLYFWQIMDDFSKDNPDVDLQLVSDSMGNLVRKLAEGLVDAAFLPDFMKYRLEQLDMKWKWAARDSVMVVMSDSHPLADAELTIQDLARQCLVVLGDVEYPEYERYITELLGADSLSDQITKKIYPTPESIVNFYRAVDEVMVTDRFFKFNDAAEGCIRKPLRGYNSGIICGWNGGNVKRILSRFLRAVNRSSDMDRF